MDNNQINTPVLRFREFAEGWVVKKLGEVVEYTKEVTI